jgi:hypothetical protein
MVYTGITALPLRLTGSVGVELLQKFAHQMAELAPEVKRLLSVE